MSSDPRTARLDRLAGALDQAANALDEQMAMARRARRKNKETPPPAPPAQSDVVLGPGGTPHDLPMDEPSAPKVEQSIDHMVERWEDEGGGLVVAPSTGSNQDAADEAVTDATTPDSESPTHLIPAGAPIHEAVAPAPPRTPAPAPVLSAQPIAPPPHPREEPAQVQEDEGPKDEIQYDILPIVAEELEDLLPEIRALLHSLSSGDRTCLDELHRKVHTLKGVVAMAGAMKARALVHSMETWMEKAVSSPGDNEGLDRVVGLFEAATARIAEVLSEDPHSAKIAPVAATASGPAPIAPRFVRIATGDVDSMATEANEAKLAALSQSALMARHRALLQEMHENGQRLFRVQRDLEIQAESQIASRRAQLQDVGEEFDPLEMDRFTKLQEISRFLSEAVSDSADIYRSLVSTAAQVDTVANDQSRAIQEIDEGLRRARLVSADAIDDRLNKVVWTTAREMGKSVQFHVPAGNSQGLDRQLLDRLVAPLEHVLRNAVAHGIEAPAQRRAAGKPETGTISVSFRQEQGRLLVEARDDGAGLDPSRIKAKAVEKQLWESDRPMSMSEAADMICTPGFSTATEVSQVAGRGVGMDVVRSEVLGMGGRFEISGAPGQGLVVKMFLPMAIASVSAVALRASGQALAIPVELVEATVRLDASSHAAALQSGSVTVEIEPGSSHDIPYADLSEWMGLGAQMPGKIDVVVVKEGDRRLAFGVEQIMSIAQFPLRPLGPAWAGARGLMGGVLLPDGHAAFLIDPARLSSHAGALARTSSATRRRVLVVDDSITVRKATAQMLEDNGFEAVLARDGRHALELLVDLKPCAILLDVEMPRMDGFECATHIKENPRFVDVPIAMITSRTAQKHRDRASSIGVEEYFGKPFREEDIIAWLSSVCRGGA